MFGRFVRRAARCDDGNRFRFARVAKIVGFVVLLRIVLGAILDVSPVTVFAGDSSSGVFSDLAGATTLATMMEGFWGMGSTVASHGVIHQFGVGGGRPGGDEDHERDLIKNEAFCQRIEENLARILDATVELVRRNRPVTIDRSTPTN